MYCNRFVSLVQAIRSLFLTVDVKRKQQIVRRLKQKLILRLFHLCFSANHCSPRTPDDDVDVFWADFEKKASNSFQI